jgi:hypothetical protein
MLVVEKAKYFRAAPRWKIFFAFYVCFAVNLLA